MSTARQCLSIGQFCLVIHNQANFYLFSWTHLLIGQLRFHCFSLVTIRTVKTELTETGLITGSDQTVRAVMAAITGLCAVFSNSLMEIYFSVNRKTYLIRDFGYSEIRL